MLLTIMAQFVLDLWKGFISTHKHVIRDPTLLQWRSDVELVEILPLQLLYKNY